VIYVVRSAVDTAGIATTVRREIRAIDAELPVYDIRTMDQVMASRRPLHFLKELLRSEIRTT